MNIDNTEQPKQPLFSILIPSWNNLPFLRLCVESIRKNSTFQHQIIIHVNEGSDGTLAWVEQNGFDHTYTAENAGVCIAMNMMRPLVKTDYMLFLNDDMYVLPEWDKALWEEIKSLSDNRFFLSSTTIQPHTRSSAVINQDYGDTVETFREQALLDEYRSLQKPDWRGATLPPNIVHRDVWDLVGGYSVELSPGMYSDPDFTAKLWLCGVRYMKGLSSSRIYHFETKSTSRIRKNKGQMQFLLKWGMTYRTFRQHVTCLATNFDEVADKAETSKWALASDLIRGRLKALYWLLTSHFGTQPRLSRQDN